MKGFKFKLDPVLKIRKLKEEQCKMEIGRYQVQIKTLKEEIERHHSGIEQSYESQEKGLSQGLSGQEVQFHPFFVQGKVAHIRKINEQVKDLEQTVQQKYIELNTLRADVKVIEKMKEKKTTEYKKDLQKKQYEVIEEQVQNWRASQKNSIIG